MFVLDSRLAEANILTPKGSLQILIFLLVLVSVALGLRMNWGGTSVHLISSETSGTPLGSYVIKRMLKCKYVQSTILCLKKETK